MSQQQQQQRHVRQLEICNREMFGNVVITTSTTNSQQSIRSVPISFGIRRASTGSSAILKQNDEKPSISTLSSTTSSSPSSSMQPHDLTKRRASNLLHQLLVEIYSNYHYGTGTDYNSTTSVKSNRSLLFEMDDLREKDVNELKSLVNNLNIHIERAGNSLVRRLKRRDALRRQQDAHCNVITGQIQKRTAENDDTLHFSIQPTSGESGYQQWVAAMKMVAQLSGGIPSEFRRRLWLTLADRHLNNRQINWLLVEKNCFSEWSHPDDAELGVQIVKDLHRTGCSLFCGEDGQENQALLKRVLLAYARWNKAVGYCQGFNMLAALILQVTDKCETDALKLMIYLIEGVLPDSYFADSLRGLSVDMAVFRELLRTKLPKLSRHLDMLQNASKEGTTSYEPPLTNVFTMQWFLTLFCNCLPQPTVLRVWDLILLEGNEILLRTALAIWQTLAERIMTVHSADEFYCIMGILTRELLESNLIDGNSLIKSVVTIGPLTELKSLREHYLYNINPWGSNVPPTIYPNNKQIKIYPKERLILDINTLKKQYVKLKQRQRQAHIIFNAAISRQPPPNTPSVAMNHLLLGKSSLVSAKRLEPPKRIVCPPPNRHQPSTLLWKDTPRHETNSSSSSSDTELCDDPSASSSSSSSSSDEDDGNDNNNENKSQDNPSNVLMTDDNTIVDTTITECQQIDTCVNDNFLNDNNQTTGDIFDSAPSTSLATNFDESDNDDNDSVDFEKFLEDRVRCLKQTDLDGEQSVIENEPSKCTRNSSARALQIIQENSLILHRILQCQSRLSPPIINETIKESEGLDTNVDIVVVDESPEKTNDKSPEYGSKYKSILEKSRSLDEKYNTLILNSNVKMLSKTWNDLKECKSGINIPETTLETSESKSETALMNRFEDTDQQSHHLLKDLTLDLHSDNEKSSNFDKTSEDSANLDALAGAKLSPKSPNRIFNPFPVTLSSRQNKEVPLKLGMYKK